MPVYGFLTVYFPDITSNVTKYLLHYFRQIDSYSTAHTADAAYVIGGYQGGYHTTGIFEFKNDEWRKYGDLQTGRQYHGSISIEHQTMVLGGWNDSKL